VLVEECQPLTLRDFSYTVSARYRRTSPWRWRLQLVTLWPFPRPGCSPATRNSASSDGREPSKFPCWDALSVVYVVARCTP